MGITFDNQRVLRVGEAASALGLPGPWTLRRLEERGIVPKARRAAISSDRYYLASDVPGLAACINTKDKETPTP